MREYPQGLWSVLLQVRQPQNDHVIDKVGPVALSDQVVVAMNHKASHPELQTVYLLSETSRGLLNRSHGGRELINYDNPLIHV